ncbi:UDP-N-acetylmuramate dehydrogenase [Stutzerimonas chloritidismutans]|uniref:UDP-N-acetylmuramate dehydrogenase n=1 Tax=Stutzerimonas chloritidismutans TaxID=203192 RepID=UPI003F16130C
MSLSIETDRSLQPFNTFGIDASAARYAEARSDADVRDAIAEARELSLPLRVIGGGSNLVLTGDVDAMVLRMASRGIRILSDDGDQVVVEAEAGEPWHPFVGHCLALGLGGLENLSLIPGTVGASPIQNVGAYGVEIKDVFAGLTAMDRQTSELRDFELSDCEFDYRDSIFKREPDRYIILRVRFTLRRTPVLRLDYGPLRLRLQQEGIETPTPSDVGRAVCAVRSAKLPDPAVLGNAGSFFKNPVVSQAVAETLRERFPDLVAYPQPNRQLKLAAGWLIERAGWKGFRDGAVGVHEHQALVLVNYGGAEGMEVLQLARRIQADISERFGVQLEIEPNVL